MASQIGHRWRRRRGYLLHLAVLVMLWRRIDMGRNGKGYTYTIRYVGLTLGPVLLCVHRRLSARPCIGTDYSDTGYTYSPADVPWDVGQHRRQDPWLPVPLGLRHS